MDDSMKKKTFFIVAGAVLLITLYGLFRSYRQPATMILVNGRIYTGQDGRFDRTVEAIAIRDDQILEVGSTVAMRLSFSADTIIDLGGKPVFPGFVDAHLHIEGYGASLMNLNLIGTKSEEEIQNLVMTAVRLKKPGQWIRGRGWDQNAWGTKTFPSHSVLDAVSGVTPVYLVRVDGHAVWVNKVVLELAGVSAETPDPPGGRIVRDSAGNPTGVFVDNAIDALASVLPPPALSERTEAIRLSLKALASRGITEAHDMGVDLTGVGIYKGFAERGELPLRVFAVLDGQSRKTVEQYLKTGPEVDAYGGFLNVRSIKVYADGALGSRGAALVQPYSDDPGNRGLSVTDQRELREATSAALEGGFQLCTHAIGDRGNNIVLNAYERAFKAYNVNGLLVRFRVEHAQVLLPDDIPRFAGIGVLPSMQPIHCTSDMSWAQERLGPERVRYAYAWRSLMRAGSRIASGSDAPVEDPNPLRGFYAAITRQDEGGYPPGGWYPEERMTREEALSSYTAWASFFSFHEAKKGTLESGKWADLVVMSDDIMVVEDRKIPLVSVEMTMVGGRIVFDRSRVPAGAAE